jgi:hypothetical protein
MWACERRLVTIKLRVQADPTVLKDPAEHAGAEPFEQGTQAQGCEDDDEEMEDAEDA